MSGIYECEISGDRVLLKRPDGRLPLLSIPTVTFDVLFTTRIEDQPMQTGIGDNKSTLETDKPHLPEIAAQWRTEFDKYMADRDERIREQERERIAGLVREIELELEKEVAAEEDDDREMLNPLWPMGELCRRFRKRINPQSSSETIAREVCKEFGLPFFNLTDASPTTCWTLDFCSPTHEHRYSIDLPKSGDLRANLLQMLKPWAETEAADGK